MSIIVSRRLTELLQRSPQTVEEAREYDALIESTTDCLLARRDQMHLDYLNERDHQVRVRARHVFWAQAQSQHQTAFDRFMRTVLQPR